MEGTDHFVSFLDKHVIVVQKDGYVKHGKLVGIGSDGMLKLVTDNDNPELISRDFVASMRLDKRVPQ